MKVVILAGGKGQRLNPYTLIIPKPLMPIGDMPILEIMLRQMKHAGIDDVIITVGYLASLLQAFFNDGSRLGLNISYSFEEEPLGTAGPLSQVEGLDSTFLVTNGDILTTLNFNDLAQYHKDQNAALTIAMHKRTSTIDLGIIKCDGNNRVVRYTEKPTYDFLVSMGTYIFEPRVLSFIPHKKHLDFPDLIHLLLASDEKVVGYPFDGYWQDLGRPDDYLKATEDFDKMRAEFLPEV
ncbi:MAG: sugar phosphate nucleotidyltransferase [Pelolinea sp.]|nr:sugar phosphate nucleotidyltransferase [Pelolinea sp.]